MPTWLRKWVDLILSFIDYEKDELARELVEKVLVFGGLSEGSWLILTHYMQHQYTDQQAMIETKGVEEV